jgi:hypothetical protein
MNYNIKELLANPLLLKTRKAGNANTVFLETISTTNIKLLKDILNSELVDLCLKDKNSANQNALFYSIENKKASSFKVLYDFLKENHVQLLNEFINNSNNEKQNLVYSIMKNFETIKYATSKLEAYEILQFVIDNTKNETIQNFSTQKHGKLIHYFFHYVKPPSNNDQFYDEEDKKLNQCHNDIFKSLLDKGANPNEPSPIRENYYKDIMLTFAFFNKRKDFMDILLDYPIDVDYKNCENKTVIDNIQTYDKNIAQQILSLHEKQKLEENILLLDTKKTKIKI